MFFSSLVPQTFPLRSRQTANAHPQRLFRGVDDVGGVGEHDILEVARRVLGQMDRERTSAGPAPLPEPRRYIGCGLHLPGFDTAIAQGENLEQGERLLHLLVAVDVLHDHLGFSVLGDDQGFPPVPERTDDFRCVRLGMTPRSISSLPPTFSV